MIEWAGDKKHIPYSEWRQPLETLQVADAHCHDG
jgi:hypothetical protein